MSDLIIRLEQPGDAAAIRVINEQAFETAGEADLVDGLRETCPERISLVAVQAGTVVGHILFTPAQTHTDTETITGMGLAPLAVLPRHHSQGIGSTLMRQGLEAVEAANYPFVIVLGHPSYYPRFGFETASLHGFACEFDGVPDEAFMIQIFDARALASAHGIIYYRPEFSTVT